MNQIVQHIVFNADGQAYVTVRVIPKSQKTEFVGILDDGSIKIRIKSVPENGKANKELELFLKSILNIKKAEIVSGKNDRIKLIRLFK